MFGTARATQEADNVIILQKVNNKKYLEIKKNRFDGEIGNIELQFDHPSFSYKEINGDRNAATSHSKEDLKADSLYGGEAGPVFDNKDDEVLNEVIQDMEKDYHPLDEDIITG